MSQPDQSSTMDQDRGQTPDKPVHKRRKVDDTTNDSTNDKRMRRGMDKSISPPPLQRRKMDVGGPKQTIGESSKESEKESRKETLKQNVKSTAPESFQQIGNPKSKMVKSPFQLTTIEDLPASSNVDTVSLKDLLSDPLISECWEFNYLHDLEFLMGKFDEDVRSLVKVNVVHGFWKREDQSRLKLIEQASKYPNINLLTAYMPEMFGTHHSKMLILLRHDSTAQVIIHTANMIPFDWTNMTQALWKSPPLPLLDPSNPSPINSTEIGSGSKFKLDLLNYLRAYDSKRIICKPLITQLLKHDFSSIRASLIASVPGKHDIELDSSETAWGWAGLKNTLKHIPMSPSLSNPRPEIAIQISSIASLGPTDKWLAQTFFKALSTSKSPTLTNSMSKQPHPPPKFRIIFPTADEVRRSLNGYASGHAIHTKILTPAQGKQLAYLKPFLCHWAGDGAQHSPQAPSTTPSTTNAPPPQTPAQNAHRKRAAPHIKTYIRFSSNPSSSTQHVIDWYLLTSANLSKQAWGDAANTAGEIRICSYEIGILVWPRLWGEGARMVPSFGDDGITPKNERKGASEEIRESAKEADDREDEGKREQEKIGENKMKENKAVECVVAARMPYDLPIIPHGNDDTPWCATASYTEPDWMGRTWNTGGGG